MSYKIQYMCASGAWQSYINYAGSEQMAMKCAMLRAKAMGRPIRVLNSAGCVVGIF